MKGVSGRRCLQVTSINNMRSKWWCVCNGEDTRSNMCFMVSCEKKTYVPYAFECWCSNIAHTSTGKRRCMWQRPETLCNFLGFFVLFVFFFFFHCKLCRWEPVEYSQFLLSSMWICTLVCRLLLAKTHNLPMRIRSFLLHLEQRKFTFLANRKNKL